MEKVFVYGTLRKGERNAFLLKNASCLAEQSWTNGILYDTGLSYPAMEQSQSSIVYGELYLVSDEELDQLDLLEGYTKDGTNNLYERIQQLIHTDSGSTMAYVYVASQANLFHKLIANGDWKEYNLLSKQNNVKVLYFAYGSCMDHKRFIEHKVDHCFQKIIGVGMLENYTLRFTHKSSVDGMGRADIVEEGGKVEGKVYEITVGALKDYLYKREGAPNVYRVTFVTVQLHGKETQVVTFTVKNKGDEIAPPAHYEEEILNGAKGYLSEDYISKLLVQMNALKKGRDSSKD